MAACDISKPNLTAFNTTWEDFRREVLDSKFPGWDAGYWIAGKIISYPRDKFLLYRVYDGPIGAPGVWAVTHDILIHEHDLPNTGGEVLFYHSAK